MTDLTLDLSGIINSAIDKKMSEFDIESQIKELVGDIAKHASKIIEVKLQGSDKDGVKLPLVHKQFETLLKFAQIPKLPILITGGAGLSKSTAVEQVAEAFQLELASISFSNQTTKTDLIGFVDANGIYRMSGFVDAFKNGKVFLADEMDACSANVLVLLNSAISNNRIELSNNEVVIGHDNFRFIATANTNLRGANNAFTARNKLDAATIDRFAVIEWELDEDLEQKLCGNDGWLQIVRKCREIGHELLDGVEITPRSSYNGSKLLNVGIDIDTVIKSTIVQAMGEDEEKVFMSAITKNMKSAALNCTKLPKHTKKELKKDIIEKVEPKVELPLDEINDDDVSDFSW